MSIRGNGYWCVTVEMTKEQRLCITANAGNFDGIDGLAAHEQRLLAGQQMIAQHQRMGQGEVRDGGPGGIEQLDLVGAKEKMFTADATRAGQDLRQFEGDGPSGSLDLGSAERARRHIYFKPSIVADELLRLRAWGSSFAW